MWFSCAYVCLRLDWCIFIRALQILAGERRKGRWRDRIGPVCGRAPRSWMSEEGLEASGQNTEIPSSASLHLARQPHVNITSTLTNMAALTHCESEGRLRHCCDIVVAWAITVTYSSLKANKHQRRNRTERSHTDWFSWFLQHIWFLMKQRFLTLKDKCCHIIWSHSIRLATMVIC